MLIGKPGSGKTTLLKQLLTNNQMYYKKFDEVVLVSPSYAKMGIKIKEENVRTKFSLDWIFQRLDTFNQKQSEKVYGHNLGGKKLPQDKLSNVTGRTVKQQVVLKDENSRFQMASMITKAQAKPKLGFV